MKIRSAKFGDIPKIVEIMQEVHDHSPFKDVCELDVKEAKSLLMNVIQRNGKTTEGGTFVAVADNGLRIEGYIIGLLQRFYAVSDKLEATDLQWVCRKGAQPSAALRLVKVFHAWAGNCPDVIVITQGNNNHLNDNKPVTKLLTQKMGMRVVGDLLMKRIEP